MSSSSIPACQPAIHAYGETKQGGLPYLTLPYLRHDEWRYVRTSQTINNVSVAPSALVLPSTLPLLGTPSISEARQPSSKTTNSTQARALIPSACQELSVGIRTPTLHHNLCGNGLSYQYSSSHSGAPRPPRRILPRLPGCTLQSSRRARLPGLDCTASSTFRLLPLGIHHINLG